MDLKERLDRLEQFLDDRTRVGLLTDAEQNMDNWRRLERLEVRVDWLIEKLIEEPEQVEREAVEAYKRAFLEGRAE
jgi:hypothetical protein